MVSGKPPALWHAPCNFTLSDPTCCRTSREARKLPSNEEFSYEAFHPSRRFGSFGAYRFCRHGRSPLASRLRSTRRCDTTIRRALSPMPRRSCTAPGCLSRAGGVSDQQRFVLRAEFRAAVRLLNENQKIHRADDQMALGSWSSAFGLGPVRVAGRAASFLERFQRAVASDGMFDDRPRIRLAQLHAGGTQHVGRRFPGLVNPLVR